MSFGCRGFYFAVWRRFKLKQGVQEWLGGMGHGGLILYCGRSTDLSGTRNTYPVQYYRRTKEIKMLKTQ